MDGAWRADSFGHSLACSHYGVDGGAANGYDERCESTAANTRKNSPNVTANPTHSTSRVIGGATRPGFGCVCKVRHHDRANPKPKEYAEPYRHADNEQLLDQHQTRHLPNRQPDRPQRRELASPGVERDSGVDEKTERRHYENRQERQAKQRLPAGRDQRIDCGAMKHFGADRSPRGSAPFSVPERPQSPPRSTVLEVLIQYSFGLAFDERVWKR